MTMHGNVINALNLSVWSMSWPTSSLALRAGRVFLAFGLARWHTTRAGNDTFFTFFLAFLLLEKRTDCMMSDVMEVIYLGRKLRTGLQQALCMSTAAGQAVCFCFWCLINATWKFYCRSTRNTNDIKWFTGLQDAKPKKQHHKTMKRGPRPHSEQANSLCKAARNNVAKTRHELTVTDMVPINIYIYIYLYILYYIILYSTK